VKVLGIDFTSRPRWQKPITCLKCVLDGRTLRAGQVNEWTRFGEFEEALQAQGPWIAGIDLPFGQPRRFIEKAG